MHIHRSAPARNYTLIPNSLLRDKRLTLDSLGALVYLLSCQESSRVDAKQLADSRNIGRGRVSKAFRGLTEAGYYRVDKVRQPDGTIRSEQHVYDTPQVAPAATRSDPGGPTPDAPGSSHKNRDQKPTLPAAPEPDEQTRAAVALLYRVLRPERRLHLGEAEALALAPLVTQWLERGCTAGDLALALLPGLPAQIHSAVAILRNRLERKMPAVPVAAKPRYAECARCHDPVPGPGICRSCAGLGEHPAQVSVAVALAGAARARAALLATRAALICP